MNTAAMLTEDQAWAAVLARNPAADAEMVYAVTTTGVFCRPTCPSRRPSRANVVFFPDPPTAIGAGYRPCRRCRPQQRHADAGLVEAVSATLKRDRPATLAELSRMTGRSPFTIERTFKRVLGLTPAQYQRQQRAASFRKELSRRLDPHHRRHLRRRLLRPRPRLREHPARHGSRQLSCRRPRRPHRLRHRSQCRWASSSSPPPSAASAR